MKSGSTDHGSSLYGRISPTPAHSAALAAGNLPLMHQLAPRPSNIERFPVLADHRCSRPRYGSAASGGVR